MLNKLKEQEGYLAIIERDLGPLVRAYIPLFETEVAGVDMIAKVADALTSGEMPK